MSSLSEHNSLAYAIESILGKEHGTYLVSKYEPQSVTAEIQNIDVSNGQLLLRATIDSDRLDKYIWNSKVSFDIEIHEDDKDAEILSLEKVQAAVLKKTGDSYLIRCQLPESVFVKEERGSIRIPFVLGMRAHATVVVYEEELSLSGLLKNLSIGGCLLEIPIEDCTTLAVGQELPELHVEFPNGQGFATRARIRHIRPLGGSLQAAVGVQFIDVAPEVQKDLTHVVNECEREAARRTGLRPMEFATSPLFIAGEKARQAIHKARRERIKAERLPPMVQGVREVSKRLQLSLMFLKNRNRFPQDMVYDCADTLIYLLTKDRKQLLYALSYLNSAPDWVRHSIETAVHLADYMLTTPPLVGKAREGMVGALLHVMGKSLLLCRELPSLKIYMTPAQKTLLQGHVTALLDKLEAVGWQPGSTCRDVIENSNERLDGSGYPAGKTAEQLSDIARYMAVAKAVDKLTHARNEMPPKPPIDAYRWVNERAHGFERTMLVEYIQTYGLYPIGKLARYSNGFLAWIVDVDLKGMPSQVHIVKNLRFPDTSMDVIISSADFNQIGKLEGIVNPAEHAITR
ncbi:PilZ domain-containing protein [Modicisalibacter tunisiensis]|uniref:PilZ domain-containing protein n=1 Tax=Modicisalibacter tunisiensis TaxID=390637 RepID=UPI001CCB6E8D|nr:PilZ domain-containing protein [Modicisalibacter tunisiensis]MBZ9538294.1 PilZ domain-containing protein [Modicisalibacter tunisiensis]